MKVSLQDIKKIMHDKGFDYQDYFEMKPLFDVYHAHEWDHGYEQNHGYSGSRRQFYRDFEKMLTFLYDFFSFLNVNKVLLVPRVGYTYNAWLLNEELYDMSCEIKAMLESNGIHINSKSGLYLDVLNDRNIVEMICEASFRGVREFLFLLDDYEIIITPWHHMNFMFYTQDRALAEKAGDIARNAGVEIFMCNGNDYLGEEFSLSYEKAEGNCAFCGKKIENPLYVSAEDNAFACETCVDKFAKKR